MNGSALVHTSNNSKHCIIACMMVSLSYLHLSGQVVVKKLTNLYLKVKLPVSVSLPRVTHTISFNMATTAEKWHPPFLVKEGGSIILMIVSVDNRTLSASDTHQLFDIGYQFPQFLTTHKGVHECFIDTLAHRVWGKGASTMPWQPLTNWQSRSVAQPGISGSCPDTTSECSSK